MVVKYFVYIKTNTSDISNLIHLTQVVKNDTGESRFLL